jgi:murein DD-endopeptidase MepM/ murein hydrolase activator NlpD
MSKQKTKKSWLKKMIAVTFVAFFLFIWGFNSSQAETVSMATANDQQIIDLQNQAEEKKLEIEKIQKKLEVYQQELETKRQQKLSLQNELEILSNKIQQLELEIKKVNLQIDSTNLEIQSVLLQILDKEEMIKKQKEQLAELIRTIHRNDQKGYLEILITNKNFSDFFDEASQLGEVENNLKKSLDEIKILKQELETKKADLEAKGQELNKLKDELDQRRAQLDSQETAKTYYLVETRKSEKKFQSLINQAKLEQQKINSEIVSLEKTIRQKLESSGKEVASTGHFIWPVPQNTITAYFHDPDYPFRYIFEHPAIDIRAAQGTAVKAADSGYVAKVKDGGAKGYSYIMLVHDNGLATVYGHVSKIYVSTDTYVNQGDIIALSGGLPGTSGAGALSTGAHLHFEVRLDGIPVNALDYLP